MPTKRLLKISYAVTAFTFITVLFLSNLNVENSSLIWVAPVSESLFITGSSVIAYILLSRGLLSGEKNYMVIGLSFLITIIPTFFWLLTWHNIEEGSFIPSGPSSHVWMLYFRDVMFIMTYLIFAPFLLRLKISLKNVLVSLLIISFFVSIYVVTSAPLPALMTNNKFLPLNKIITMLMFFLFMLAFLKTIELYRVNNSFIFLSFSFFLVIYAVGHLSFIFSDSRFDLQWLFGKAENIFAFGILITALMVEYSTYYVESIVARSIQKSFRPDLPKLNWLETAAEYKPAFREAAIGGDWFDIVALDNDNVFLILGDAIGKGIQAISTMTEAKFLLRGYILEGRDIDESLNSLNDYLYRYLKSEEFVTIAIVKLQREDELFKFALAGHPGPLLISNKDWRESDVPLRSLPLGLNPGVKYPIFESAIKRNEILCIYSDGVLDAKKNDRLFGEVNLANYLFKHKDLGLEQLNVSLLESVSSEWQIVDDFTIILAKITQSI